MEILDDAQSTVVSARAEAGAFERNVIDSSLRRMHESQWNLAGALSAVQDADYAAETAQWARDMVLADTAVSVARLSLHARRMTASLF
jgi:flagellin-like hook-associated protein FlgL